MLTIQSVRPPAVGKKTTRSRNPWDMNYLSGRAPSHSPGARGGHRGPTAGLGQPRGHARTIGPHPGADDEVDVRLPERDDVAGAGPDVGANEVFGLAAGDEAGDGRDLCTRERYDLCGVHAGSQRADVGPRQRGE